MMTVDTEMLRSLGNLRNVMHHHQQDHGIAGPLTLTARQTIAAHGVDLEDPTQLKAVCVVLEVMLSIVKLAADSPPPGIDPGVLGFGVIVEAVVES